jgi:hypothetical protein
MSITLSSAQVVVSVAALALASGAATATAVFCATAGRRLRADVRREDLPEPDLAPAAVPVPAAQIPEPEPEAAVPAAPDPAEDPDAELDPLSPASKAGLWQGRLLADDLPEPALVWWPEHAWHRNPTGHHLQLRTVAVATATPREIAVTTVVGDQVFTDRCEVKV